ncbi:chromosomal replication initiator protein DnaA [Estrella lausannensis]|uniref:Chromosomal replication initiator protein DnaA n=1 Tax=Estrella lausannensis TaxID=483423 RepID=A0A0H5DRN0_9BACT|nr:chromosomal replication initiator protein DnaA [Estrella lausannensis]CRX39252.1 Chromosomal replication initiator protein DnaA 1 [Estrella lausannensis]
MKAWEQFIDLHEESLGKAATDKWLRSLKVLHFDAGNLFLEASDPFQIMWFEEHMRKKVKEGLFNNNNREIKVHLSLAKVAKPLLKKSKKSPKKPEEKPFALTFDELDTHSTFNTFLPTDENRFAQEALKEAISTAKDAHPVFNPLFLYGKVGSGKTHLLKAAAKALQDRGLRPIYCRLETFTEHVVSAIRMGEMSRFREAYRTADALLIDDIDQLGRKSATQEELFHTFNTLHVQGKQIILASSCPPKDLQHIEPRLVSRFEWGLSIPLTPPSKDSLKKILAERAQMLNFSIKPRIVDFLTDTFPSSPTASVRALEALALRSHIEGIRTQMAQVNLSLPEAAKLLSDLIKDEEEKTLTPEHILKTVAEHFGIRKDDITGKSQTRECALPRQIAIYLCRTKLSMPYMKIGDLFGRDHSTIMSSFKLIQKGIDSSDPNIAPIVSFLDKRIG